MSGGERCVVVRAGLRMTPSKGNNATADSSRQGKRLFGADSSSDGDEDSDSDADDTYMPEVQHLSTRGKGTALCKRKRHGQLPSAAGPDKVC